MKDTLAAKVRAAILANGPMTKLELADHVDVFAYKLLPLIGKARVRKFGFVRAGHKNGEPLYGWIEPPEQEWDELDPEEIVSCQRCNRDCDLQAESGAWWCSKCGMDAQGRTPRKAASLFFQTLVRMRGAAADPD